MVNLYENIKSLCDERHISPFKVCAELGYSKNTISSLKSGATKTMTARKLKAFADYFGITVDELLDPQASKTHREDTIDLLAELNALKRKIELSKVYLGNDEVGEETISAVQSSLDVIKNMLGGING